MVGEQQFVIQRDGSTWYTGLDENGVALWIACRQQRQVFQTWGEAWTVYQQLQQAGLRVMLFAIEPDAQGETE